MNPIELLIQIVTALAIIFAVLQLVGSRTQQHREFENLYVQRYWDLLDKMSTPLYQGRASTDLTPGDARLVLAYLRLCEDELDLRRQGFVTDRTWKIWSDGIRAQLESAAYKSGLAELGPHDVPALRNFLESSSDPLVWAWLKRWWSGLT